ncbi:MAG: hypothetical protein QGG42_17405, partial [Phycisphaerae bacterium]|nr:hypothetical protein [Phycisphaerae bacterium]
DSISVVLANVLNGDPKGVRHVNPTLPKDIDTILAKTLSRFPQERYNSMGDFAEDLERFASGRPILAKRANWMQRLVKWSQRRPAVAVLLALMIAMIITGAGIWTYQEQQTQLTETQARKDRAARLIEAENAERWRYARLMAEADRQWRGGDIAATKRLVMQAPATWRNWEWALLNWRCRAVRQSLTHSNKARFLAWRPDGKALAISSTGDDVQILDLTNGKLLRKFSAAHAYIGGAIWLADGKQLVSTCGDGHIRVWDAETSKQLQAFDCMPDGPDAGPHDRPFTPFAVSPDQRHILVSGSDRHSKGWGRMYDLSTGRLMKSFTGHDLGINAITFAPNGKDFATAGQDGTACVWSTSQNRPVRSIKDEESKHSQVLDVAFTPNGKSIVTCGSGGLVQLWDPKYSKIVHTFQKTGPIVRSVAISPDGTLLAGAAENGTARLWDISTGRVITTFVGQADPLSVRFSPNGKHLAVGGNQGTKIWDVSTRQEGVQFGLTSSVPAFTCDGAGIVALTRDGRKTPFKSVVGRLQLWSPDGRNLIAEVEDLGGKIAKVACHPTDANLLAVVDMKEAVDLWNLADNRSEWTIPPPDNDRITRSLLGGGPVFSPDGRILAVGSANGPWDISIPQTAKVGLYDTASGKLLKNLTPDNQGSVIFSASFSPDGKYVAAASPYFCPQRKLIPGGLLLWRVSDGKHIRTYRLKEGGLYGFAFSPDGKQIALGSDNGAIRILNADTERVREVLHGHTSVIALAFSADGQRLVSAGLNKVLLWDLFTAQPIITLSMDSQRKLLLRSVAFSPDGSSILTGGYNRQMRLWSVPPGDSTGNK